MFISICVCLNTFVFLYDCPFVCLCYLSVCHLALSPFLPAVCLLSSCLSVSFPPCMSVCLPKYLSFIYVSFSLFVCLSTCSQSVCQSSCLSVCLSVIGNKINTMNSVLLVYTPVHLQQQITADGSCIKDAQ